MPDLPVPSGSPGAEGSRLPDADPRIPRAGRGPLWIVVGYFVVVAIATRVLAVAARWMDAVGLLVVLVLFGLMIVLACRATTGLQRTVPDTITIFADRVEGNFTAGRGPGGSERRVAIPFRAVEALASAGPRGKNGVWSPASISANYARLARFDPASVRDVLRGPPTPPGCAQMLTIASQNFEPLKAAYLRAVPNAVPLNHGDVRGPDS